MIMRKKFDSLGQFDEKKELHETLKDLRSKYDSMVEECNKKERKLKRIQDEISSIQLQKEKILKEEKQCEENLKSADTNLKTVQNKLQEVSATKRTYEYMLDRVKKDHLINQKNSISVDRKIERDEISIEKNRELLIKRKREEAETRHAISVINQRLKEQKETREDEMGRLKDIFKKRQELEQKRQARLEKQKEVAENAITQNKDLNEQKWRRLLLVHKFLGFFLRKKMDRELKRFSTVEDAYRRIKASTGISDPEEIVKKYFTREKAYSELLLSIAKAEKKLEELKRDYSQVCEDKKVLKEELMRLERIPEDPRRQEDAEKSKEVKLIEELTKKITEKQLEKKMMVEWLGKMYEKLISNGIIPSAVDYQKYIREDDIKRGLEMMFSCLRDYYERLDEQDVAKVLLEVERQKKDSFEVYHNEKKIKNTGLDSPSSVSSAGNLNKSRANIPNELDFN